MGQRCTEKVDLFSLGVVLWELVTGDLPARGRLRDIECALNSQCCVGHTTGMQRSLVLTARTLRSWGKASG